MLASSGSAAVRGVWGGGRAKGHEFSLKNLARGGRREGKYECCECLTWRQESGRAHGQGGRDGSKDAPLHDAEVCCGR